MRSGADRGRPALQARRRNGAQEPVVGGEGGDGWRCLQRIPLLVDPGRGGGAAREQAEGGERTEGHRVLSRIGHLIRQVHEPRVFDVKIRQPANDFSDKRFTKWLARCLRDLGDREMPEIGSPGLELPDYRDGSGLVVGLSVNAWPGAAHAIWTSSGGGFIETPRFVQSSLRSADQQVPDGPNLVILRPYLAMGLDPEDMLNALFGSEYISFDVSANDPPGEVGTGRMNDGFIGLGRGHRLSAAAVLNASGPGHLPVFSMDVYHSDVARHPWNWNSMRGKDIRHLVRASDTAMEWLS